ncbi:MAG: hypothetical protein ACP5T3_03745, partial [Candidatus Micrarchaeia archaeon]
MPGYLNITNKTGIVYSKKLIANYTNETARYYTVTLSANLLSNGTYAAKVSFSNQYTSATNASSFELLNPANIVIVRFFGTGSTVSINSPFYLFANLTNFGPMASMPFLLNISVAGPEPFFGTYRLPGLAPGASVNVSIPIPNVTVQHGTNVAHATAYYGTKSPTANVIEYNKSNTASFSFYVLPGKPVKPVTVPV